MATLNGFLQQNGPEVKPRMTAGQKDVVLRGAEAAFLHWLRVEPTGGEDIVVAARNTLKMALDAYPTDRSCFSCDYRSGAQYCLKWSAEIPGRKEMEAGCEAWQDDGAPF